MLCFSTSVLLTIVYAVYDLPGLGDAAGNVVLQQPKSMQGHSTSSWTAIRSNNTSSAMQVKSLP